MWCLTLKNHCHWRSKLLHGFYTMKKMKVNVMKNITSDNVVQELWKVNADTWIKTYYFIVYAHDTCRVHTWFFIVLVHDKFVHDKSSCAYDLLSCTYTIQLYRVCTRWVTVFVHDKFWFVVYVHGKLMILLIAYIVYVHGKVLCMHRFVYSRGSNTLP